MTRRELLLASAATPAFAAQEDLIGHWPLDGDARDLSVNANHGRWVDAATGRWVEIPHAPSLDLGTGDFTIVLRARASAPEGEIPGNLFSKFDPATRTGFTFTISSSAGGYNAHGTDRHAVFSIDSATEPKWDRCGRPSPTSNYVSNSLTVFDGALYAATTDGATRDDWAHVYRYAGGTRWEDCGRVGSAKTRGVGPMIVHRGALYAATWSYDWRRVDTDDLDVCRVWRYCGGRDWEDCGQPGACRRLFGLASFRGRLYIAADDRKLYEWDGARAWRPIREFPSLIHPMVVHRGRLYLGAFAALPVKQWRQAIVEAFDGQRWESLGCPLGDREHADQIHDLEIHRGLLHATTWPTGHVAVYENGRWVDLGLLGDSIEINALNVYNGKLYAGTIPRAELFRFDGESKWTPLRRFFAPKGWEPVLPGQRRTPEQSQRTAEWTRITSLTRFGGCLFAGIGSCTSALADAPADVRGEVHAMTTGASVAYDKDLGSDWRHFAVVRRRGSLELFVDGRSVARSTGAGLNLSSRAPFLIGNGATSPFGGSIRAVRLYRRALDAAAIRRL